MVYIYEATLSFKPIISYDNSKEFLKSLLKHLYAEFEIHSYSINKDLITVNYMFKAGKKIKGNPETFKFMLGDKIEFVSFAFKEILGIKRKSYLEYVAECRFEKREPMSFEEFKKEYFNEDKNE